MSERKTEYRVMIHPSDELSDLLKEQLSQIAEKVYKRKADNVIYRVKTVKKQTNPRKLFAPGDGEIIDLEIPPHMALGQKIMTGEKDENEILKRMEEITSDTKPFTFVSTELGDYREDFTIFLAFSQSDKADNLLSAIEEKMKLFFPAEREKKDILHFTLVYDDTDPENIKKAWKVVDKSKLVNKELPVASLWLWKNKGGWKSYKEFPFKSS